MTEKHSHTLSIEEFPQIATFEQKELLSDIYNNVWKW
jgi:hypothetical protein